MPVWRDIWGSEIRIPDERLDHVRLHVDLLGNEALIELTLAEPDLVVMSSRDPGVRIYEKRFVESPVGDKRLWVIVRWTPEDAFVITSYFTDRRTEGTQLWP